MPVHETKGGYQYGKTGKVYKSKKKAIKQALAIAYSKASKEGRKPTQEEIEEEIKGSPDEQLKKSAADRSTLLGGAVGALGGAVIGYALSDDKKKKWLYALGGAGAGGGLGALAANALKKFKGSEKPARDALDEPFNPDSNQLSELPKLVAFSQLPGDIQDHILSAVEGNKTFKQWTSKHPLAGTFLAEPYQQLASGYNRSLAFDIPRLRELTDEHNIPSISNAITSILPKVVEPGKTDEDLVDLAEEREGINWGKWGNRAVDYGAGTLSWFALKNFYNHSLPFQRRLEELAVKKLPGVGGLVKEIPGALQTLSQAAYFLNTLANNKAVYNDQKSKTDVDVQNELEYQADLDRRFYGTDPVWSNVKHLGYHVIKNVLAATDAWSGLKGLIHFLPAGSLITPITRAVAEAGTVNKELKKEINKLKRSDFDPENFVPNHEFTGKADFITKGYTWLGMHNPLTKWLYSKPGQEVISDNMAVIGKGKPGTFAMLFGPIANSATNLEAQKFRTYVNAAARPIKPDKVKQAVEEIKSTLVKDPQARDLYIKGYHKGDRQAKDQFDRMVRRTFSIRAKNDPNFVR